ncbi:D-alanyl-D-alanine carboxypeptidase DacC [Abditibacteriota bacterium]|nr:D-alanyl-D-alanine carboxypeptidase DacC [Abditibacteriota bacterium]
MRQFFLFALLFFLTPLMARAQDVLPPNYAPLAESYVVLDLDSGRILYSKNPDERLYPASTTKTMTALVAYENGKTNAIIRVSKEAAHTGESSVYLKEGEQRTLDELIRAALVRSANDACVAIADGVAGSIPNFAALMNAKVKQLGLKNTHFVNPHGLHDPNHFTSARDLALIGRAFTEVPYLNSVVRQQTTTIGGNAFVKSRLLKNRNKLLARWAACDGIKTGSTKQAGHCLVATATERDPRTGKNWRLLSVVLKSKGNFTYLDTEYLLQKAFNSFAPQTVVKSNEAMWQGDIKGGAFPLEAVTTQAVEIPLRADEVGHLSKKIELLPLPAPLKKGQPVGSVTYFANGQRLAQIPLVARADVPQTLLSKTLPGIGNRLFSPSLSGKFGWGAAILGLLAILLLWRRARIERRRRSKRNARSKPSFEPVPSRDLNRRP